MRSAVFRPALSTVSLTACGAPPAVDTDASTDSGSLDANARACSADPDCNDGVFCSGVETCTGDHCATETLPCDDGISCTEDFCNETGRNCVSWPVDQNLDGFRDADCLDLAGIPIGNDCDDDDADAFPGNTERCDSHDEDSDPV